MRFRSVQCLGLRYLVNLHNFLCLAGTYGSPPIDVKPQNHLEDEGERVTSPNRPRLL